MRARSVLRHIPNILSALRLAMIPFIIMFGARKETSITGVLLVTSGITDLLDGFLARRFGWITQLGKILDPAADKLTQLTVCVLLFFHLRAYWPYFVVVFVKEGIMLLGGLYFVRRGIKLEGAKIFGKVSTFSFYVLMIVLYLFSDYMSTGLVHGLLFALVCISVFALISYIPDIRKYYHKLRG